MKCEQTELKQESKTRRSILRSAPQKLILPLKSFRDVSSMDGSRKRENGWLLLVRFLGIITATMILCGVLWRIPLGISSTGSEFPITGAASWYSTEACKVNSARSCPTASGRSLYDLEAKGIDFAAAWDVPFGTRFKVTNLENGRSVVVCVLDRGPARRLNRAIDLSKSAFQKISPLKKGLIRVRIERLP